MNLVILKGRLGKDAEHREHNSKFVINFTLATSESYKDKDGNRVEQTEWHNCVLWHKSNKIAEYLTKGTELLVNGKIQTTKHEEKYYTKIIVSNVEFCGSRNETTEKPKKEPSEAYSDALPSDSFDDSLPF